MGKSRNCLGMLYRQVNLQVGDCPWIGNCPDILARSDPEWSYPVGSCPDTNK